MDLHKAIRSIHNEVSTINGDTQETIVATDINGDEININWIEVNSWTDPNEYKYKRELEYPTIVDQLDMQYWDNVNGTTTWKDAIAKVKSDNPKE